jgi:hypothetical protein
MTKALTMLNQPVNSLFVFILVLLVVLVLAHVSVIRFKTSAVSLYFILCYLLWEFVCVRANVPMCFSVLFYLLSSLFLPVPDLHALCNVFIVCCNFQVLTPHLCHLVHLLVWDVANVVYHVLVYCASPKSFLFFSVCRRLQQTRQALICWK